MVNTLQLGPGFSFYFSLSPNLPLYFFFSLILEINNQTNLKALSELSLINLIVIKKNVLLNTMLSTKPSFNNLGVL